MMYKVLYSSKAQSDLENILIYISCNLKNNKAAFDFMEEFKNLERNISLFPYNSKEYKSNINLKYNYRRVVLKKYIILYIVNDKEKTVIISQILYCKRNIDNLLK